MRAAVGLIGATSLFVGYFIVQALLPNPWAEHAIREPPPRWFHDFFYGGRKASEANEISRGLELLVEGELEAAIRVLEPLGGSSDGDPEASAYLGVARYLSGDESRSTVRLLERGIRSHRAGRLSRWYLASVLLMRRDVDAAREQLEALAMLGDWFGRAAGELLEKLDGPTDPPIAA